MSKIDITLIACDSGATIYRNRASPHQPALAFGDDAWAHFIKAIEKELQKQGTNCTECGSKINKQIPVLLKGE